MRDLKYILYPLILYSLNQVFKSSFIFNLFVHVDSLDIGYKGHIFLQNLWSDMEGSSPKLRQAVVLPGIA